MRLFLASLLILIPFASRAEEQCVPRFENGEVVGDDCMDAAVEAEPPKLVQVDGLQEGDIVTDLDGQPYDSPATALKAITGAVEDPPSEAFEN